MVLLAIIYLAFISLGLPDSVLGVAWPYVRDTLKMPLEAAGLLAMTGTLLAAFSGFTVGKLTLRFTTGPVVLASGLATATGLLLYANAPSFVFLILAAIPLGLGAGGVDSSLNAYVAKHYSSRHMNWLHSFWGVGATLGPLLMTAFVVLPPGWRGGYLTIAVIQFVLAAIFLVTLPLWKRNDGLAEHQEQHGKEVTGTQTAGSLAAWLSVGIYMLYVTAEFAAGLWAYTVLVTGRGFDPAFAGLSVAAYYGSIMGGRMLTGIVVGRVGNRRMVTIGLLTALSGALLLAVPGLPWLSLVALVLLGLGFAPIYPCLMHETPRRFLPEAAPVVIGRQVGGSYLGGAFLPGLLGWAMASLTLELLAPALGLLTLGLLLVVRWLNKLTP